MKKNYTLKSLLLVLIISAVNWCAAQGVAINATNAAPDPSAGLDVSFTNKGVLIPRLTTAERDSIPLPAHGLMIYNVGCNNFNYYDGVAWVASNTDNGYAPATPGVITGNASVCANSTGNIYSISTITGATTYTWSVPSGSVITAGQGTTSITVTFGNKTGNISVTESNECGTSSASSLGLTLSSAPATPGPLSGYNAVTAGQSLINYSISAVQGASVYDWTMPTGASIISGDSTTDIEVDYSCSATSGNILVRASNSCGTSNARSMAIAVTANSIPATPGAINGGVSGCSTTYSISPVTGATSYLWTVPSGATITAGQGTTLITASLGTATTDSIRVKAVNSCGTSAASALALNTGAAVIGVAGAIQGYDSVCQSQQGVIYQIAAVSGATSYLWTLPPGAGLTPGTLNTTNSISVNYASSAVNGSIGVIASNSCGSASASVYVTVNKVVPVTPGAITGSLTPPANSTGNAYSISTVPTALTYIWTLPAGSAITAGVGTTSITASFGTTGSTLCVTANNGCGASPPSCIAVDSATFNATGTGATGTIQRWTVPTGVTSVNIIAYGASGAGGSGAMASGTFSVTPGHVLRIIVGQQGVYPSVGGSGGGGSFVWDSLLVSYPTFPMLVAGGGGGNGNSGGGANASDTTITNGGGANGSGAGGTGGAGGGAGSGQYTGYGGGGWSGDGAGSGGGQSALHGGTGGGAGNSDQGGFGGGAEADYANGGGGGGYNGGGGGNCCWGGGGGGGSYIGTTVNVSHAQGARSGNGEVIITW